MKKRNSGLDLLRCLSMIMIVILHYLAKGGVLWNTSNGTGIWFAVWTLEALCYTSVNIFVLISAFFLSNSSSVKKAKLVDMMVTVWLYSWIIGVLLFATGMCRYNTKDMLCVAFPFMTKSYWFMNCYILLYLAHPYLNKVTESMRKKEFQIMLLVLICVFSVAQSISPFLNWTMDETHGYGMLWFITLYFTGVYIRRYPLNWNRGVMAALCIFCSILCCVSRFIIEKVLDPGDELADIWYAFNSLPVYISSVCMFGIFQPLRIRSGKATKFLTTISSCTLGVYLFHEQYKLKSILWVDILHVDRYYNSATLFAHLIVAVLLVFTVGIILEYVKKAIFKVLLRKFGKKHMSGGEKCLN